MEEKVSLVCIQCPVGCMMEATVCDKEVINVENNRCKRGEIYAKKELVNPTRILTSTVLIEGATIGRLPVKTSEDIPKEKIFECIKAIKSVKVKSPVEIGDIIIKNVANTGVDIIATRNV